ncbi:methyltransferase family protein [Burkholderia alba]|uniref:methyltransferase family protein n=1 Tax=Burkholderia alba TaxID=2683677 RepID=UPI002B055CD8|nr:isoprenylcysteine carboxylmethyltransferase family protein [Burkholderia alba]
MGDLSKRMWGAQARFLALFAAMLFVSAGSLRYWQGWLYWLVFAGCTSWIARDLLAHDPGLVERRMKVGVKAEREFNQKIILGVASVACAGLVLAMGLEWRVTRTPLNWPAVLIGNALVIAGFVSCFYVLRENHFASSIIEVTHEQTVIASGPYARVRHPMYAAAMVIFFGSPLATQSFWALAFAVVLAATIVARLLDEERYLKTHLAGYDAYCAKVRWRLVPHVW